MRKMIKPEKIIEQQVKAWAAQNKITIYVFDAKMIKTTAGMQKNTGIQTGTPDLLGYDQDGRFIAIELKAPGKRNSTTLDQYLFLVRAIESGCFACVCDDVQELEIMYHQFKLRRINLLEMLPLRVTVEGKTIPAPKVHY